MEGRLQTRSYDDKDSKKVYATEVVAEEVFLLGGRGEVAGDFEGAGSRSSQGQSSSAGARPPQRLAR